LITSIAILSCNRCFFYSNFQYTSIKPFYLIQIYDLKLKHLQSLKKNILRSMGLFDWRDPSKRKTKRDIVEIKCDLKEIYINNVEINFPTNYETLKNILGEATRIEPIKQTKNNVYLWDDLGIYCSTNDPEKMLMLLLVEDNRYGLGHQPKSNFTGTVFIDGESIEDSIQNVEVDRPYMIRSIIKEDKQVAIALGWNPGVK